MNLLFVSAFFSGKICVGERRADFPLFLYKCYLSMKSRFSYRRNHCFSGFQKGFCCNRLGKGDFSSVSSKTPNSSQRSVNRVSDSNRGFGFRNRLKQRLLRHSRYNGPNPIFHFSFVRFSTVRFLLQKPDRSTYRPTYRS